MADDIRAGDVVVCVRDKPLREMTDLARPYWAALKVGNVYRVERLVTDWKGSGGVTLVGVSTGKWPGWSIDLFRKIDAPDTEIARRIKAPLSHREPQPC